MRCLLCQRELEPSDDGQPRFVHPDVADCEVAITDAYGVSIDDAIEPEAEPEQQSFYVNTFPFVDEVMQSIFDECGLARLGGASTGLGWTSFSLFQRCPYAWKRRHIDRARPLVIAESPAIAIGAVVHVLLALHYAAMIDGSPYAAISPEFMHDRLKMRANPEFIHEGWRVFEAYRRYYSFENIVPLAVEYDLRDPRSGESCRFDLIAFFPDEAPGRLPGTYNVEHKTAGRFDHDTLTAWPNDGEILGQVSLWERLGLDKRFGKLQGVIVNILGKHKETKTGGGPQFHRTIVAPTAWQIDSHRDELKRWEAARTSARATGSFPRARGNCVNRWGRCEWYDSCATGER